MARDINLLIAQTLWDLMRLTAYMVDRTESADTHSYQAIAYEKGYQHLKDVSSQNIGADASPGTFYPERLANAR